MTIRLNGTDLRALHAEPLSEADVAKYKSFADSFNALRWRTIRLRGVLLEVSPAFDAFFDELREAFRKARGLPPRHYNPLPKFGLRQTWRT